MKLPAICGQSPGPVCSGGAARAPWRISRQPGQASQPSARGSSRDSAAARRLGALSPPCSSASRQRSANSGSRAWITGKASAMPAQYAAGLVRSADCSPTPPKWAGNIAKSRACGASGSSAPPRHCLRICQTARSWARRGRRRGSPAGAPCEGRGWHGGRHKAAGAAMSISWRSSCSSSSRRRAQNDAAALIRAQVTSPDFVTELRGAWWRGPLASLHWTRCHGGRLRPQQWCPKTHESRS